MIGYSVLLVASLAIGAGFFVRAVTGFAAALIALPILFTVFEPMEAVALLSVYFFIFSMFMLFLHRKHLDTKLLAQMGLAILVGLLVGTFFLSSLSPGMLMRILGVFLLCYLAYHYLLRGKFHIPKKMGIAMGFAGGVCSGVAASGGSLYASYMHDRFDNATLMRANIIGALGIADVLRLPVFVYNGVLDTSVFVYALALLPIFGLAIYAGHKFHTRINPRKFQHVVACVLAVSAVTLIVR